MVLAQKSITHSKKLKTFWNLVEIEAQQRRTIRNASQNIP